MRTRPAPFVVSAVIFRCRLRILIRRLASTAGLLNNASKSTYALKPSHTSGNTTSRMIATVVSMAAVRGQSGQPVADPAVDRLEHDQEHAGEE